MVEWCGLEWEPACLDFQSARRPVQTMSVAQVRRPIDSSTADRWKDVERPVAPFFSGF
jgi:hypothetical protein